MKSALNSYNKIISPLTPSTTIIDHLIIGAGVVGLAIAERLAHTFPNKTTILVERHPTPAQETSSRNSEVVHSGIYYPPNSLKSRLCIRGRSLLRPFTIKTGKLIVATHFNQIPYLQHLNNNNNNDLVRSTLLSGDQARQIEPSLSNHIPAALYVPDTGIIDSHTFIQHLESKFQSHSSNAYISYRTTVVRIDDSSRGGWLVHLLQPDGTTTDSITATTVINSAGLSAPLITNSIIPSPRNWIPMYFAKGSYATYSGPGISGISHLIYPCPPQLEHSTTNNSAFQSLGTHLTLDTQGQIKFGPDIQWIQPKSSLADSGISADFWMHDGSLIPGHHHNQESSTFIPEMYNSVKQYLPSVQLSGFSPAYVGIRPKLVGPSGGGGGGGGFQDFVIRKDGSDDSFISLLGIESPGLTASLAIAEMVVDGLLGKEEELN